MSLEKEIKKDLEKEKSKGFFVLIIFIVFFFIVGYIIKGELNKFNENINQIDKTKDIVFGNINNEKEKINNFSINIEEKEYSFRDINSFKDFLIKKEKENGELLYTFIGIKGEKKDDKVLFEYSLKFKELGYFLNNEEIIEYVKKQLLLNNNKIQINLGKYSYIDQKKVLESAQKLKEKYTKDNSLIKFDSKTGFSIDENNLSFYILTVIKENIKKIDLNNPNNIKSYIYFSMKKNNVNDELNKLNKIFNLFQKLDIDFIIKSDDNENNLNILKKALNGNNLSIKIDKSGIKFNFKGIDNLKLFKYVGDNINYIDYDFFKPGITLRISNSNGKIIVVKNDFYRLTNLNINDNYPSKKDFSKLNINNGFEIKTDYLNKIINEYIKYIIINEDYDYDHTKELVVKYAITNNNDVEIKKVVGHTIKFLNYPKIDIFQNQGLYSIKKDPLKIKDIDKIYQTIGVKHLYLNNKEIFIGEKFQVLNETCYLKGFDSNLIHIECGEDFYNSIETNGKIDLKYDMFGFEFDVIGEDNHDIEFIKNGEKAIFHIQDNGYIKDSNSYYDIINTNYIEIDKKLIDNIKYKKGEFNIYFKSSLENWYIKSSLDYDQFYLYFISLQ